MKLSEYTAYDGLGLADLVRRREVTPLELVEVAFQAVEQVNPRLNAVIALLREQAEAAARAPLPDGPFAGVPFLVKDLALTVAGTPMTMGSRLFAQAIAPIDSELMLRYRRAGLVLIGKTNTPEFGISFTTEPAAHGPTRNPYRLDRIPGGSSGGSAAAVAARVVPMAHGNDGGGSLRVPASCCGAFGLKPTRVRTPAGPMSGLLTNGLTVEHAITRSVRDSAALLDATAGPDVGAPFWPPQPERPFLEEVSRPPGRLRIGFTERTFDGRPVNDACQKALRDAVALCQGLGHELVEAPPPYDERLFKRAQHAFFAASTAGILDILAPRMGLTVEPGSIEVLTALIAARGRELTALDLVGADMAMNMLSRQIGAYFTQIDVLLTPTLAEPPVPLGVFDGNTPGLDGHALMDRLLAFAPFTGLFNVTGNPAMSVPLHMSEDGLPIGVQFVGRYGDEATLFRLAGQLEQAAPWAARRPEVCAG